MKKSIFVVVALIAAMVLSFSSCKSNADKMKSATEDLKAACKDKDVDAAKKYIKEAGDAYFEGWIDAYNSADTKDEYEEAMKDLDEANKEFNKVIKDCDCLKESDIEEVTNELHEKYSEKLDKASEDAQKKWK